MADQQGGKVVYEVDIETAGLIEGSKKAKAEISSLGDEVGKTAPSFDKMSKSAKGVSSALAMPEVNKLSNQLAQLSGKIGASSDAANNATVTQNKFSGALGMAARKLGAGYVSNVGSATASLLKHAQGAIAATNAQMENAIAAQKEAIALQGSASQLVITAAAEKGLATATAVTAQSELAAAEAIFERKQGDIQSLEVLLSRQKESLKQSEANLEISSSEKAVADAVRARSAVEATQNKILKQSNAAVKEVNDAEDKVKKAKESSILASQKVTQAVALEAVAVTTVAKANEVAAIATQKMTVAAKAQTVAVSGARSVLSLLGGSQGILLLAAAGVYLLYQALNKGDDIEKFKQNISEAAKRVEYLDQISARAAAAQTRITIIADTKSLGEANTDVAELKNRLSTATRFNAPTDEINELSNSLSVAEGKANDLQRSIDKNKGVFGLFTQRIKDAGAATSEQTTANELYGKTVKGVTDSNELLNNALEKGLHAAQEMAAEKELRNTLAANGVSAQEAEVQVAKLKEALAKKTELTFEQELKSIQDNVKALKIEMTEGKAAAVVYRAAVAAANAGLDPNQTKEYVDAKREEYQITKSLADQKKNDSTSKSSAKKDANAAESVAQKLANLKQQSELAADSTRELSREQAILTAQQSLGASATQKDIELAGKYKAAKWDTGNAIRAQAAAEKLIAEKGENSRYGQETKDLNTALNAQKISRDQFNEASERAEQQHQVNLAKIRADKTVTPLRDAQGGIDPVQALANEHAKKLELIKRFETQKGVLTANGLALMNAENTEYEKARTNAMWELWSQQSTTNGLLASSLETIASSGADAFMGIIDGSMSATDALKAVGEALIKNVISSLIQMGVQYAMNAILANSSIAAITMTSSAAAGTLATAWAPAAAAVSLASFGANAIPAAAGITSTYALTSGLSATGLAGARKNGGPVSAGSMYQVGEGGMPEIYQSSSGRQYMIPGDNGSVISNKDMQSGGSGSSSGITVIIQNMSSNAGVQDYQTSKDQSGNDVLQIAIADINNGGALSQAISNNHQAPRRATQ